MNKIKNPTKFRENIREKLCPILNNDLEMSTKLEKGVYNYSIKEANSRKIIKKWENPYFAQLYVDRLRTVYMNLKNKELLTSVLSEEITPQSVAFMTHQEMDPDHWKVMIDKKMKRDASLFKNEMRATTDMFICKKCHSRNCSHLELQTRSADEPATIFVTCLDCGKHWRC